MTSLSERVDRISRLGDSIAPAELMALHRTADAVSAAESTAARAEAEANSLRYALRHRPHFAERGGESPTEVLEAALAMLAHFSEEGDAPR